MQANGFLREAAAPSKSPSDASAERIPKLVSSAVVIEETETSDDKVGDAFPRKTPSVHFVYS